MELLERQTQLTQLARNLRAVADGCGKALLVGGEAGVGKSSLVEAFVAGHGKNVRVLWGNCDALRTPRVLGPVYEVAARLPALEGLRGEPSRERLFAGLFGELCKRPVTIIVLEDIHWADEATLDFVAFIVRRIQRTLCLFLATFRDDEISAAHPLRRTLGDLTGNHVARLALAPLSENAVAQLAHDSGRDATDIYSISGGNPFFVRELLAASGEAVPETVRDAVLARVARCSEPARAVAELVSLLPGKTELWLLESMLAKTEGAMDAVETGLLRHVDDAIAFRHELARLAVESSLQPAQARQMHRRILHALQARSADLSRLVHHAERSGEIPEILEYAPRAGREAAALGAHREAAEHYASALRHGDRLPPEQRADLLDRHAWECYVTNQIELSVSSAEASLALWRSLGNTLAESRTLLVLSRQHWKLGNKAAADQYVAEAIDLLERQPEQRELGMAYSARSQLDMLEGRVDSATSYGHCAIELARRFGDPETESHALNNVGTSLITSGDDAGYAMVERSLEIARTYRLHEHAGRAYANLSTCSIWRHDFPRSRKYLEEGIAYCEDHENFTNLAYLRAYLARFELERGRWNEAADVASSLLRNPDISPVQRIPALVVLALVRVRRGDPAAEPLLDEAAELASRTGELQRIGRVAAARAELAWYRRDIDGGLQNLSTALELAKGHHDSWIEGELLFWRSRFAAVERTPDHIAKPYRLMIDGEWQSAAQAWKDIGMPFEEALALSLGPEPALRRALDILEVLGAGPLAAMVRRRLREQGVHGIPRGPRSTTRQNPAGLTNREIEVLELLVDGHSNADLARRLHVSVKTVGHHVSAILAKLEVRTRTEAATAALRLGIAPARD